MTRVIIIRHQVVDNPKNMFYGVSNDLPISEEGKANARNLGRLFAEAGIRPSAIITSDLLRARQTGEEFRKGLGLKISHVPFLRRLREVVHVQPTLEVGVDSRLSDVAYPKLEGLAVDNDGCVNVEGEGRISLDHIEPYTTEPLPDAAKRFQESLRDIVSRYPEKLIAIVSHADPIAYGLERMQYGEQACYSIGELEEKGAYLQKGEFALVRLTSDGILNGPVHFRPEIASLSLFLERNGGGKEGNRGV